MFVAGLLCIKAYRPRQYSALATAAMRYLIETIKSGTAAFTVKKPLGPKVFDSWMFGTSALAAYEKIVGQLKGSWKKPPTGRLRPLPYGAPRTRRYKQKHHLAGQLYYQRQADRIKAVQRAADTVLKLPVDDRLARTWVKDRETPAAIGLVMMGRLLKRSPRAMKDLLNQARKQLKFAKDFDGIAAARGLRTASDAPVRTRPATTEDRRI